MSHSNIKFVCFGEVLFDVFPNKRSIGGAPLNVALRLASFGMNSSIISRVGNDELGTVALNYLKANALSTNFIHIDNHYETGQVVVGLDMQGSASYTINYPAAWDKIEVDTSMKLLVQKSDVFIFGSLICRDEISFSTLKELLHVAKFKVFDVNLRSPHYDYEKIVALMLQADFLKFNDDELTTIAKFLDSPFCTLEQNIDFISKATNTNKICVTRGNKGAVLLYGNKLYYNDGYKVEVADTVGAGDSFLAGLLSKFLAIMFHKMLLTLVAQLVLW